MEYITKLIEKNIFHRTAVLDPRCKFLMLFFIGLASYFINGDLTGVLLMVVLAIFISVGNGMKWAIKMMAVYLLISFLNTLLRYVPIPGLSIIMSVFGVTVLKIIPIMMIGRWILRTTCMDDLMVSLERAKMPQSVTIPMVVMFRYIPTLGIEYRMIRNTMQIRGIGDTFLKKLLHPLATIEYILIPLLMRCLKVTDELAASGTTRGLERVNKRYALHVIRFGIKEYTVTAATVLFLVSMVFLDQTSIGTISLWR